MNKVLLYKMTILIENGGKWKKNVWIEVKNYA